MSNLSKIFRYVNANGDSITFDYPYGFLINKPVGIDTISVSLKEATGVNQIGTTVQSVSVQSRPINISGVVCGSGQAANKDKLVSVIRPDIAGKLYADDYYLDVYPSATPTIGYNKRLASFQFSLLAAYPYWRKDETVLKSFTTVTPMFKFPWNISREYQFGEVVAVQFLNIYNGGQVPVPFTVTITAQDTVVNPKLIDAATNNYLLLNKTLVADEKVVVEITHGRTYVTSSVDGDCRGALSLNSKFYRLAVGDNVIKPDADEGKANMIVKIEYAIEKLGVTL